MCSAKAFGSQDEYTYSSTANLNPIQPFGPVRKLTWFPHTPGIFSASLGIFFHRSGLTVNCFVNNSMITPNAARTHLNVLASGPQTSSRQLTVRIGIRIESPLAILSIIQASIFASLSKITIKLTSTPSSPSQIDP